jgi:predicted Zn-dependent protease
MQARQGLVALAQVGSPDVGDLVHAMVAARARVLSNLGVDVLRAWVTEPDAGGFAALSASRRAAVLYAGALASKSLRDFARAGVLARQLGMLVAGDVAGTRQARLLAAEIALAAGDMSGAARWLEEPAAGEITRTGRPELLMRAAFLTQNDQSAQAADLLRNWLAEHPRDAAAWQTLAAAYAAQGQPLHAIRAEGEVQMAYLDYAGAVDRFKAARALSEKGRNPPEGHIEASIIDTRLRQAESLLREQALER